MTLTPLDIQEQQFRVKFRGFDVAEVDTFLERVANAFEALEPFFAAFHDLGKNLDRVANLEFGYVFFNLRVFNVLDC